jgi:hypothetical protein
MVLVHMTSQNRALRIHIRMFADQFGLQFCWKTGPSSGIGRGRHCVCNDSMSATLFPEGDVAPGRAAHRSESIGRLFGEPVAESSNACCTTSSEGRGDPDVFTKESEMNVRKCLFAGVLAALAWAEMPQVSEAQIFIGGGRGGWGRGYGGYGYNRGWGYGPGWGYGRGYYGSGINVGIGTGLYNRGYYGPGYANGGYYNSGYYSNVTPTLMTTGSVGTNSYQSFYPSDGSFSSGDCCCAATSSSMTSGGMASNDLNYTDGRGVVVVNVPENAEVFWNGDRSTAFGTSRRFATLPLANDGSVQKFEARWRGPDGQMVTQMREIRAMPNQTVAIDFNRTRQDGSEESSVNDPNRGNTPAANPTTNPNTNNPPANPQPLPDRRND